MEDRTTSIELLFEKAETYARTNVDLLKLKAIDKSADVLSSLVSRFLIGILVSLIVILMNIGLALWIGDLMGKAYSGFFIVAGLNVIIGLILLKSINRLIKIPVYDSIISQMLKEKSA
jgi:hypothetical protein